MAILNLSGNIPVHSDWLIIMLSGRDTTFSISLSNFVDILSEPALDFGLRFHIFFFDAIRVCASRTGGCKIRIKLSLVSCVD